MNSFPQCFSSTVERITLDFININASEDDPRLVLGFDAVAPLLPFSPLTKLDLDRLVLHFDRRNTLCSRLDAAIMASP